MEVVIKNIALYRKYRPTCFSQIISQTFIVNTLKQEIINNNIYHAYVFSGTRGSGKTSIARIFAKAVNCSSIKDGDCCNKCDNCSFINENNCLDIYEIDAASNSGVEEIRKLIDTINYLPTKLSKKIYIIDEAHMLSNNAWNALLKTIEEPPIHVLFIFATTEVQKIPLTIMSRCQRFDFYKLPTNDLCQLIDNVTRNENILISNDAKIKLSQLADGSARDCLSILHQLSDYSDNNITLDKLNEVFGLTSLEFKINLINSWRINDNLSEIFELLETKTNNYLALVNDLINIILDKIVFYQTNDINLLKHISLSEVHQIKLTFELSNLFLDKLIQVYEKIKLFGNGLFYLKTFFIDLKNESKLNQPKILDISIDKKESVNNSELFETKTLMSHIPITKEPIKIDYQLFFDQIISNENKNTKNILNEALILFKSKKIISDEKILNLLNNSIKFLVTSNNGAIILFEFRNEANEFNKLFWSKENYSKLKQHIFPNNDYIIIASDKITLKKWKDEFKSICHNDVDINLINELKELSIDEKKQKILDILKD